MSCPFLDGALAADAADTRPLQSVEGRGERLICSVGAERCRRDSRAPGREPFWDTGQRKSTRVPNRLPAARIVSVALGMLVTPNPRTDGRVAARLLRNRFEVLSFLGTIADSARVDSAQLLG